MDKFDIHRILEEYKPDMKELAKVLYPDNKLPERALDRVLSGEAFLDSNQITKLAAYLGVFVSDLFAVNDWKGSWDRTANCPVFLKGRYKVMLNYNGAFLTTYRDHVVIRREIRSSTDTRTLNEFMAHLDAIIKDEEARIELKKALETNNNLNEEKNGSNQD